MNYAQIFLMNNMGAFPPEQIPLIQRELEQLDDESFKALLMTEIKNPMIALLLSIFLGEFGVDRFYAGQKEMGIAKLALLVISFITLFILIGFVLIIGVYVWKVVDWFLIMGATRQANFERLMFTIHQIKAHQHRVKEANAADVAEETVSPAEETSTIEEAVAEVGEEVEVTEEVELDETDLVIPQPESKEE